MTSLKEISKDLVVKFGGKEPSRSPKWTEDNPIGLDQSEAVAIARELDQHQASMFVLFHQYQKHHWLVEGPQFRDLHLYLEDSYNAVHKELDAIAERITVLGAIPTASPKALAESSYVEHEPEGYFKLRDMLEHDLEMERAICVMIRKTISRSQEANDFGTATLLKQVLMAAEDRAHHLDHYLAEDGLRQ
jgi:starvation-inducible DNA-binding protein